MLLQKPCDSDWDLCDLPNFFFFLMYRLLTDITRLVSGLNEAQVLDVSLQKEFSETQSDR